jgi:hypothetical protein
MNDKDLSKIIRDIVFEMENEGGKNPDARTISTGKSRLSFGRMQHDMGKPDNRPKLDGVLKAGGLDKIKERG